jgi:uncharacterized membrane protein YjgN (DUF898 family)
MGRNDRVKIYNGNSSQRGTVEIHITNNGGKSRVAAGDPNGCNLVAPTVMTTSTPTTNYSNNGGVSYFSGSVMGLIGISCLMVLLTLCTLGIGLPWAFCIEARWYARHTKIDGREVVFDGTGGQLFGNCMKWGFITIVTLGFYVFWLPIKFMGWVISHTHLD